MEAIVKWFNNEKGYGFIKYTNENDIFVHYSALKQEGYKSLNEGDVVEFELLYTPKGYQAADVILKTTKLIKKSIKKENIEIIAAIATIASFVLGILSIDNDLGKREINIDCKNCEIEIIENTNEDENIKISIKQK